MQDQDHSPGNPEFVTLTLTQELLSSSTEALTLEEETSIKAFSTNNQRRLRHRFAHSFQ